MENAKKMCTDEKEVNIFYLPSVTKTTIFWIPPFDWNLHIFLYVLFIALFHLLWLYVAQLTTRKYWKECGTNETIFTNNKKSRLASSATARNLERPNCYNILWKSCTMAMLFLLHSLCNVNYNGRLVYGYLFHFRYCIVFKESLFTFVISYSNLLISHLMKLIRCFYPTK